MSKFFQKSKILGSYHTLTFKIVGNGVSASVKVFPRYPPYISGLTNQRVTKNFNDGLVIIPSTPGDGSPIFLTKTGRFFQSKSVRFFGAVGCGRCGAGASAGADFDPTAPRMPSEISVRKIFNRSKQ